MADKGYVVRGLYKGRHAGISDLHGSAAGPREPRPFATLDYAAERAIELRRFDWSDVAIYRLHDDGREERLPSYEEALDRLGKLEGALSDAARSPLAALEAAERRLLEAGGWTPGDRGFWVDPCDGTQWPRAGAVDFERKRPSRLAAKGGA